jgi:hypothetical protein
MATAHLYRVNIQDPLQRLVLMAYIFSLMPDRISHQFTG